jgi:hypothetical protein
MANGSENGSLGVVERLSAGYSCFASSAWKRGWSLKDSIRVPHDNAPAIPQRGLPPSRNDQVVVLYSDE